MFVIFWLLVFSLVFLHVLLCGYVKKDLTFLVANHVETVAYSFFLSSDKNINLTYLACHWQFKTTQN